MHTEWTVRALEAGKHVLCEKPFATSAEDAARCFDAAEAAGRHCVEGLMWRHHPQTTLASKLVADGAIGRLAYVRAALSVGVEPGDIGRSVELGGGALNDLGCYCVSGIRLFAGEPSRVYATQVRDGPAGVGLRLAATLRMPGDVLAQLDVGLDLTRREPIPVDPDGAFALTDPDHDVYRAELDTVSAALVTGAEPPFGRPDAVAQATALEALHRSAELATPVDLSHGSAGRR